MSSEFGVPVWTIETTSVNADHDDVAPYQAVIAVEGQGGRITCARTIGNTAGEYASTYDSAQELTERLAMLGHVATRRVIPFVNDDQAGRFREYFEHTVAPNDTTQPAAQRPEVDYNCFDFVRYVARGEERHGWVHAAREALAEARGGYASKRGPFGLGEVGYVIDDSVVGRRFRGTYRHSQTPLHTFIGLGGDSDECLSVLVQGGPIAITPRQNITEPYDRIWLYTPVLARARRGLGRYIVSHFFPNKMRPGIGVRESS